jgi:hypothetical protein
MTVGRRCSSSHYRIFIAIGRSKACVPRKEARRIREVSVSSKFSVLNNFGLARTFLISLISPPNYE